MNERGRTYGTPTAGGSAEWVVEARRHFHEYPELAYEEHATTRRIVDLLAGMGAEVRTFHDLTGAAAVLRGRPGGRCLALRADIDALPIQERSDVPFTSRHEGRMHACGHDGHTAIALGVARRLVQTGVLSQ
ncbi:MAG: M20/M25/M40 family metallo-hydrolase, partial [Deltaproteobacteria bacterium]|nr:M20/M25/M40 family metallo-hydrolase [Deltaproteobacteria bacterium]